MSILGQVDTAVEAHHRLVEEQVRRARSETRFGGQLLKRWKQCRRQIATTLTPTGIELPALALPATDEPGEIARYLFGEGLPGEFPFQNATYPEMYLETDIAESSDRKLEEPTRLFAGLSLAEDTNQRFHYLTQHQKSQRLSTAFDGPTLYGLDSDSDGVFGKVGEGGVAIDTTEDMERLYARFPLGDEHFSASMTINGPAPIILAMYV